MAVLYLDVVGGMAGDMTVGALVSLGVPLEHLRQGLAALGPMGSKGLGIQLDARTEHRHGIAGVKFMVGVPDAHGRLVREAPPPLEEAVGPADDHGHVHSHPHVHHHPHGHPEAHPPSSAHAHGHGHRSWREIRAMLEDSALAPKPKALALDIFGRLAAAEAHVHAQSVEDVRFHEVGALDAIADVVCVAQALDYLAPDAVYCSAIPVGRGLVRAAHGMLPLPAPATLHLLTGFTLTTGGPAYERTTPTGAAILAAVARPAPSGFAYRPERVGIGVGTLDPPGVPNILRAVWVESAADGPAGPAGLPSAGWPPEARLEAIEVAEANVDDANPEWLGHLMERLLAAGALDVAFIPAHMKKNRPGTLVQALYRPELRGVVAGLMLRESTTLGVRFRAGERAVLPRRVAQVATPWGAVAGKVTTLDGQERFTPEYESCKAVATQAGVPLQAVYQQAVAAYVVGGNAPTRD